MTEIDKWTEFGQKLHGPNWYPWYFEAIRGQGVMMTGAECPLITRGKNKGQPNFKKRDKSTERKVFVPNEK